MLALMVQVLLKPLTQHLTKFKVTFRKGHNKPRPFLNVSIMNQGDETIVPIQHIMCERIFIIGGK